MAIQSYIETVRAKPEHVRRRWAFWWAFGISVVIFVFWLASFSMRISSAGQSSSAQNSAQKSVAATVSQSSSPGQSMVAGVGALGTDIWQLVFGPKKVTYSAVEVLPGK